MTDEMLEVAADGLRRAVTRVARQLRRLRADHGVSAAKLSVLGQLYRAGKEVTAVDLARLERLQPQSLTRMIAELDERGLLLRRQDEADRRQMLIGITPAGKALLQQDAMEQTAWLARAMADSLTPTERGVLALAGEILERLASGGVFCGGGGWGGRAPRQVGGRPCPDPRGNRVARRAFRLYLSVLTRNFPKAVAGPAGIAPGAVIIGLGRLISRVSGGPGHGPRSKGECRWPMKFP
jgi:DNA-binding MarR family transcriptional regulator